MSDRRTFLSTMTGSLAGVALGPVIPHAHRGAITVSAEPSVFWRHPDGRANLVRFFVAGTEAPAGRLRVYDRARRLLGTAGMLRVGDGLRGELWLSLDEPTTVLSELEAPGRRTPHRTAHRLIPPAKWTLLWLTIADPRVLERTLSEAPVLDRFVRSAIWREAGVIANPIPPAHRLFEMDHLPFLRATAAPERMPADLGLATASVALVSSLGDYPATTPLALSAAGIRHVVRVEDGDAPLWWPAPDGSRVLTIALADDANPVSLGFSHGGEAMARRVEAYLGGEVFPSANPTRVLVQAGVTDTLPRMVAAVRAWNGSYAFPRIVIGGADDLDRVLATPPTTAATAPALAAPEFPRPSSSVLERIVADRALTTDRHVAAMLAPIATLLTGNAVVSDPARRISSLIDSRVPGWLVVNPSPFRRTDTVQLPDGRLQLVTDIPSLGYAFVLDEGVAPEADAVGAPSAPEINGARMFVALDPSSGAIRSLREQRTGREWLRGIGGNAVATRLEAWERRILPGIATQLAARRYSADHGDVQSVVTVYDHLPWIDVENRVGHPEQDGMAYTFEFAVPNPTVRWEIPAGHHEDAPPLRYVPYLRWLALDGASGSLLIGGPQTPYAGVGRDGYLEFPAPSTHTRFRILPSGSTPSIADCTRFGWGIEPLRAIPVTGMTTGVAPRFGHAVVLDQPDAALIGLKAADDGNGIVAYIQNLTPDERFVSIGFGLLAWSDAHRVDLREHHSDAPTMPVADGVAFDVPAHGVAAVRLTGVRLRGP
jgi:hypothetical protein